LVGIVALCGSRRKASCSIPSRRPPSRGARRWRLEESPPPRATGRARGLVAPDVEAPLVIYFGGKAEEVKAYAGEAPRPTASARCCS
jgi:hypothetical protein